MKKLIIVFALIFAVEISFGESLEPQINSVENLLAGYLQNNLTVKNLAAEVEKKIISKESAYIENGFAITLSTGTLAIELGDKKSISFTPQISASLPKADNLKFTASSSVLFSNDDGDKKISSTSFILSGDIYSGTMEKRKIALLESERELLEAQRSLQDGFLSAETEFYKSLKTLYEIAASIVQEEKNLYEDKLLFEETKAKGYSPTSTKYRLAQSEVLNDEHKVEIYKRKLERETRIFASKCGIEFYQDKAENFLPSEIPEVTAIDVHEFKKENYKEIQNAEWEKYINTLKRKADKSVSLSANAGFVLDKRSGNSSNYSYADSLTAGIDYTWNSTGLVFSADAFFPIENFSNPSCELGISFAPNQFLIERNSTLQEKQDEVQEDIAIKEAEQNYLTNVISQKSELTDLLWEKSENLESFDMYTQLEKDMATYFAKGLISESEYKSAQVNRENYRIQLLINNLDLIIYNNETKMLFTRDEELQHEKK